MSFLGKILVVLQLVVAATFMCFAGAVYTYHTSWREEAKSLQTKLEAVNASKANLETSTKSQLDQLTTEKNTAVDNAATLSAANSALTNEVATLKSNTERLSNDLQTQTALANITAGEVGARRAETIVQRKANTQLHTRLDASTTKNLNYEKQVFQNKIEKNEMIKKYNSLLEEVAIRRTIMKSKNLEDDMNSFVALSKPAPDVDGVVLETKEARNGLIELVTVSLGSNDGFVKGHRLLIYESGLVENGETRFLGEIELVMTEPNKSVGRLIEKAKNGIIRKGNNVTSSIR